MIKIQSCEACGIPQNRCAPEFSYSCWTILTFEYPPTSATVEKVLHPLVEVASVTNPANVIIFPLRDEDVERRRKNAEIDKELEENTEEEDDAGKRE